MALKKIITKEEFEKLSEALKAEYIKDGEGGFKLDVDGDEDSGALKRAKDREVEARKAAEAKASELEKRIKELEDEADIDLRKKGDIETLERAWNSKLEKTKTEYEQKLSKIQDAQKKEAVDNLAFKIASEISTAPALILPHIKARLVADFAEDNVTVRILDRDGKISALTTDELSKEFVDNKDFSSIIVASKASGSAGFKGSGAPSEKKEPTDLAKLSPEELVKYLDSNGSE